MKGRCKLPRKTCSKKHQEMNQNESLSGPHVPVASAPQQLPVFHPTHLSGATWSASSRGGSRLWSWRAWRRKLSLPPPPPPWTTRASEKGAINGERVLFIHAQRKVLLTRVSWHHRISFTSLGRLWAVTLCPWNYGELMHCFLYLFIFSPALRIMKATLSCIPLRGMVRDVDSSVIYWLAPVVTFRWWQNDRMEECCDFPARQVYPGEGHSPCPCYL